MITETLETTENLLNIIGTCQEVEIKLFEPGKFANRSIEYDENIVLKRIQDNYIFHDSKGDRKGKVILHLPKDTNTKLRIQVTADVTIKNEKSTSPITLDCQNLVMESCDLPNTECKATGEKTVISNSKLHTLASVSDELFVSFSNIDFLCYYHIAGSKQNHDHVPFPIRLIDCNFDKIVISTLSQIYISGGKFSQFISDELARLILFKEVECGNISIKKGDVHFSDCNFIINNEMNIENAYSKITITNSYNKNLKLRKPLFQKEYHIIKKKEKIYTIKGKNKVKVLKI